MAKAKQGKSEAMLARSLASAFDSNNIQRVEKSYSKSKSISVEQAISLDRITVTRIIDVPDTAFSNDTNLDIELTAIDKSGARMVKKTVRVSNKEAQTYGMLPRVRPFMEACLNYENMLRAITCIQRDPYATGISIYYRPVELRRREFSPFKKLASFDLMVDELYSFESIEDLDSTVIVRAIPTYKNMCSGKFIDSTSKPIMNSEAYIIQRTTEACLHAFPSKGGITISIYNPRGNYVDILLARRVIIKGPVPARDEFEILDIKFDGSKFLDTDVIEYNMYEYKCGFLMGNGIIELSEDTASLEYFKQDDILRARVVCTESKAFSSKIINTFSMSAEIPPATDDQLIVKSLQRLNIDDLFSSEIESMKGSLSNLVFFYVNRKNLVSGVSTRLGYQMPGEFSDIINVKSRDFGMSHYLYTFEVFIRSASRLIEESSMRKLSSNIAGSGRSRLYLDSDLKTGTLSEDDIDFSLKFTSEVVSRHGTLSYGNAFEDNHPEGSIGLGKTGVVIALDVVSRSSAPGVKRVKVKRNAMGESIITWTLSGNSSHIDHFIIYMTMGGITRLIGTSHHVANNGHYTFIDSTSKMILGTITYDITPVLLDFSRGRTGSGSTSK